MTSRNPSFEVGGRVRQRIVDFIVEHPDGVSCQKLIDLVYGDDAEGGPDNARHTVSTIIGMINKILAPRGWEIESRLTHRYTMKRAHKSRSTYGRARIWIERTDDR